MSNKTEDLLNKVKAKAVAAGQVAAHAADVTAKKAEKLMENTKLNFKLYELKGEADGFLRKVGAIVYSAHIGEEANQEDLDDLMAVLDEKYAEIDEVKEKIAENKSKS